jgi:hypothetical protein
MHGSSMQLASHQTYILAKLAYKYNPKHHFKRTIPTHELILLTHKLSIASSSYSTPPEATAS